MRLYTVKIGADLFTEEGGKKKNGSHTDVERVWIDRAWFFIHIYSRYARACVKKKKNLTWQKKKKKKKMNRYIIL